MEQLDIGDRSEPIHVPRVRVLIVNYNSGAYLQRCVTALLQQTITDFEVKLVDNGSSDASLDNLPTDPRLHIDRAGVNLGFAAGNNRAAADADTPYLAFLNPDAIPAPDWLESLLSAAQANPAVVLFGSLQLQDHDPAYVDGAGDAYFFAGTAWRQSVGSSRDSVSGRYPAFSACAAAALIRREWFERLGGFDGDYFCYFEDVDLAFRLRLLRGGVLQVNDAIVRHAGSVTAGARSDFVLYHVTRNQIWTFLKSMPAPLLVGLLPIHAALLVVKWINAIREKRGRVFYSALRDAMCGLRPLLVKRAAIQRQRSASSRDIAAAMTWSITSFSARAGIPRATSQS